jgi:D-3-phosphoglycerate dehydrogenase
MLDVGSLSLVVRAGAGYNTIDVAAASRRGIYISNCPGKNSIAVAELTFGLILALDRRIPDNVAELRAGKWNKKEFSKAAGLFGRTLGLIGFGNIGQETAKRAQAFGMNLVIWSRRFARGGADADLGFDAKPGTTVEILSSPAEVAERADVVSVHLAMTPETRGMIGADILTRMKRGAYFVNTARAEVVDYRALEAGEPHAGRPSSGSPWRAGPRVRSSARRESERSGDREHHLRRRAGGRRAHQPGR